jgi:hypothetical protein
VALAFIGINLWFIRFRFLQDDKIVCRLKVF